MPDGLVRRPRVPPARGTRRNERGPARVAPGRAQRSLTTDSANRPLRPSEVVRGAGTRGPALRQDPGPLLGLRGATGHDPDTLRRLLVPSARPAFPRPPGVHVPEQANGLLRPPAPRALASLQRPIAAPPHRRGDPKARASDDASFPGLCPPHDTYRDRGPVSAAPPGPAACHVRGLATSCAARTPDPARPLRAASVHGLLTSRRSPRADRAPSREPLPSCRCARRFASLLKVRADATGFRALIPASSSFRPPTLSGRSVDASLRFVPPVRSPPPTWPALWSRTLPHHALGGLTSLPACVSRSCDPVGWACPSRGCRHSWDSSPCDRHGTARNVHGTRIWFCCTDGGDRPPAPRLSPVPRSDRATKGSARRRRPSVNGCCLIQSSEPVVKDRVGVSTGRAERSPREGAGRMRPSQLLCDQGS